MIRKCRSTIPKYKIWIEKLSSLKVSKISLKKILIRLSPAIPIIIKNCMISIRLKLSNLKLPSRLKITRLSSLKTISKLSGSKLLIIIQLRKILLTSSKSKFWRKRLPSINPGSTAMELQDPFTKGIMKAHWFSNKKPFMILKQKISD